MTARVVAPLAAVAGLLLTLGAGGRVFGWAVVVAAAIALWQLSEALDATGPRPILAAAAVAGVGTPLRLVLDRRVGLDVIPTMVAAMLLTAFVLVMVTGRRHDVARIVAATAVSGLMVGLGGGGLVLLRSSTAGVRWTLGLLLLVVAPEAVAVAARRLKTLSTTAAEASRFITAGAVGGGLIAAAGRPLTPLVTAGMVAVSLGTMYAAALLHRVLLAESAAADRATSSALRPVVAVLLAGPVVFLLATAVQA